MPKNDRRLTIEPLALRPDNAAAALGISRASLMKLVSEGRIRGPVVILRGVVLFDFSNLRDDWEALRDAAGAAASEGDKEPNPWDRVLPS